MIRSLSAVALPLLAAAMALPAVAQERAESPGGAVSIDLLVDTVEDQTVDAGSYAACTDGTSDDDCSLREAIEVANANAELDVIGFDIPVGGGVATLSVGELPDLLDDGILIDGYTQQGSSPSTKVLGTNAILAIELTATSGAEAGLVLAGDSQGVRGLAINRFGTQVWVSEGASGARVMGNYIGTTVSGYSTLSPLVGVRVQGDDAVIGTDGDGADDVAEGNLIAGFELDVLVSGDRAVVAGNVLGMVADGTSPLFTLRGLDIRNASEVRIGTNGDGVSDAAEANIISGHGNYGIAVTGALGGDAHVAGNIVGGTSLDPMDPTYRNPDGIFVSAPRTLIGTDGDGSGDVAERNWITAGRRDFTGCGVGVTLLTGDAAGSVVAGNQIRSVTASAPLPCGSAIQVNGVPDVRIGTNGDGVGDLEEANLLVGNARTGVYVRGDPSVVAVLGNTIGGNGLSSPQWIGIDLAPEGVTPNDDGDADGGPNGLQNFPVLTRAVAAGAEAGVGFSLHSTPSTTFRVELFANAAPDASGHGQGERFLGATLVTADAAGHATGSFPPDGLVVGEFLAATATPVDAATASGFGGTSEFSAVREVEDGLPATSIVIDGPRGIRYLGAPAEGVTVDDLAAQNLVRGVPGYYPAADPANLYTRYDADKGTWLPSEGTGEALRLGYAFRWSFTDRASGNPDISVSRPLPFTLSTDRPPNTDDVLVDLNTTGSRWNYLANPFGRPVDLTDADLWPGYFGISSPAYVYDPVARSWEDAPTVIEPWGAVRVRSKGPRIDGSGRSLRILASSQVPEGDAQARRAESVPQLSFRLDGTDADGLPLADAAFTVAFDHAATVGLDAEVDVEKLQAPATEYVLIGSRVGDDLLGYDVRPFADAEIPLALDLRGAGSDLVLRWDASALPTGLPVVLVDLATGEEVDIRTQAEYAFQATAAPALDAEPQADVADPWAATDRFVLQIGERVDTADDEGADRLLRLESPRPNPSAGLARVAYVLPEAGAVRLAVLDVRGREVATLVEGAGVAGRYYVQIDTGALSAGAYVVRLTAGGDVQTQRMVVVK